LTSDIVHGKGDPVREFVKPGGFFEEIDTEFDSVCANRKDIEVLEGGLDVGEGKGKECCSWFRSDAVMKVALSEDHSNEMSETLAIGLTWIVDEFIVAERRNPRRIIILFEDVFRVDHKEGIVLP
jgi:hypothetical protein